MELFAQAERIQREAIAAAWRFIPMIQENVCGAQKYVGRARWHYGSFYLWDDVPALMPITIGRSVMKEGVAHRSNGETNSHGSAARALPDHIKVGDRNKGRGEDQHLWTTGWNVQAVRDLKEADGRKGEGGSWFNIAHGTTSGTNNNPARGDAVKIGGGWFHDSTEHSLRRHSSGSNARKAASARIAKIPLQLARHIAKVYYPGDRGI